MGMLGLPGRNHGIAPVVGNRDARLAPNGRQTSD
ncbi:hypothetical protein ABIA95_005495 [Bradyrhizobium sp. LA8.1]